MLTAVIVVVVNPTFDALVFAHIPPKTVIIFQEGFIRMAIDVHIISFGGLDLQH